VTGGQGRNLAVGNDEVLAFKERPRPAFSWAIGRQAARLLQRRRAAIFRRR
jgi:hypothetical protein